jgi:hypothetical protein
VKAQEDEVTDLNGVKAGDSLFIKTGNYDKGRIVRVDRVTPTGRVIAGGSEFNPNGRKRGSRGWDSTWARLASEDDIAGIYRHGLVRNLEQFRQWEKMSPEDLKAASALVDKYKLPR